MPTPASINRILLLRPSALGDVCRTVPVLASLRRTWPEAEIHWVVQTEFTAAVVAHPALSGVIPFPRSHFRRLLRHPSRWPEAMRWLGGLRRGGWDLAVDCQGLARTGLMLAASGASVRAGDRRAREGAWIAANRRARTGGITHEVDRMLAVAAAAGAEIDPDASLFVPPAADAWWRASAERREGSFAVLATTSRWPSKAWPAAGWIALGTRLVQEGHVDWIALPGSRAEVPVVEPIAAALRDRQIPVVDWSGQTDVGQLMAVIRAASITISNDSAALHMAAGLGGRCLGLFGPTDPDVVGPWRMPDAVLRAPLQPGERPAYRDRSIGDRIMSRLGVDAVYAAAAARLKESGR